MNSSGPADIDSATELVLHPIGILHSDYRTKFDAPHQPRIDADHPTENRIELFSLPNIDQTLHDIEGFERLWLIWWFHRNKNWAPMVMPPRGPAKKRGVFATRSPHRPNPLGMTSVALLRREGRNLIVGEVDLISGTPILDIKPYIPKIDAYPTANAGWVDELEVELANKELNQIHIAPQAAAQLAWLKEYWGIDFFSSAMEILERYPEPHPTRRIVSYNTGFRMACGAWRIFYRVEGNQVQVTHIEAGYPERLLSDQSMTRIPDREAQIAFRAQNWTR